MGKQGASDRKDAHAPPGGGGNMVTPKIADIEMAPTGHLKEPAPDPIQFILQDHDRQLELCTRLEELVSASEAEPIAEWGAVLLSFLTRNLPLHVNDEELDLFPRLKLRRPSDSSLDNILDQLVTEHETDTGLAGLVIKDLRAIADGRSSEYPELFRMRVRAYCEMQRRHLNWENRVVLPLAETLLTDADRRELARRMIARRNNAEPA
jgi:hemerythrin-like domain-containing protein